mmetsp:Transcript_21625/g.53982  ORF Transcript_21625/g.53982 Transcript_21625/m.53982 type:complete len:353 (+) Transcript_21625:487-1545(+)
MGGIGTTLTTARGADTGAAVSDMKELGGGKATVAMGTEASEASATEGMSLAGLSAGAGVSSAFTEVETAGWYAIARTVSSGRATPIALPCVGTEVVGVLSAHSSLIFEIVPRSNEAASMSTRAWTARFRRPPGLTTGAATPTSSSCCISALPIAGAVPAGTGWRSASTGCKSHGWTRRRRRLASSEMPAGGSSPSSSIRLTRRSSLRSIEFHRFLMALSVLPGNIFTISDQRVPYSWTASTMARSSSALHLDLRTSGLRWLCHLSRHCFPDRPSMCLPTTDQRTLPAAALIHSRSFASSSMVQTCFFHAPWFIPGLSSSSMLSDEGDCSDSPSAPANLKSARMQRVAFVPAK